MPAAVLIDGAYFIKRFRSVYPENAYNAARMADMACRFALIHLDEKTVKHPLYRIFFYDCPPVDKKMHFPVSKCCIDFSKSPEAVFRNELHERLKKKRKLALRLGKLQHANWRLKHGVIEQITKKKLNLDQLTDDHYELDVRQKGVDMRIGLDIASLALKKQVNKIILMAGDADFVPAAKLARREGIDFILDPLRQAIPPDLNEHIDGLRSVMKNPNK